MEGQWWWAVIMLVGGLLAGGYVFMLLGKALSTNGSLILRVPIPRHRQVIVLGVALCGVLLGLMPLQPFRPSDDWPARNAHECSGVRFAGDERGNVACDGAGAAARNAVCLPVRVVAQSYAPGARALAATSPCPHVLKLRFDGSFSASATRIDSGLTSPAQC